MFYGAASIPLLLLRSAHAWYQARWTLQATQQIRDDSVNPSGDESAKGDGIELSNLRLDMMHRPLAVAPSSSGAIVT